MIEIDKTPLEELTLNGILALEGDRYNVEAIKVRVFLDKNCFGFSFHLVHRVPDEFGRFNTYNWIIVIVENGKVVEFFTSHNGKSFLVGSNSVSARETNVFYFDATKKHGYASVLDMFLIPQDAWDVPLKDWTSKTLET